MNAAFNAFSAQFHLRAGIAQNWKAATDAWPRNGKRRAYAQRRAHARRVPAERYYTPNEPVVLLAGDAAKVAERYGGDGRYHPAGRYLVCRLDSGVLRAVGIGPSVTLQAAQFSPRLPRPSPNNLPHPRRSPP